MVALTRINGETVYVNPELILFIEETPDTVMTFRDGQKLLVREGARDVVGRVISYARQVRGLLADLEGGGG